MRRTFLAMVLALAPTLASAADLPNGWKLEEPPSDPKATKVVLIAGSNFYKPGEHDYRAAVGVLADLLKQTPGVAPVLAIDWPTKPETLAGAKAVVFFFDGGDKHGILQGDRYADIRKLADGGAGIVLFHQSADVPKDWGDRQRNLAGGAWEKGLSQRGHWVAEHTPTAEHPVSRGVTPFNTDEGWLWKHRFVEGLKGVTPLVRTVNPKSKDDPKADGAIVSWVYERPEGGRAFVFTGGHLHKSFAEEGYRKFLVNGILWSAGINVPKAGAPVALEAGALEKYLTPTPPKK